MNLEIMPLISVAAITGIVHTIVGPDHYLPFIALAKARSWSRKMTAWITFFCGLGHILSSVVIGYLAIGLRISLGSLHVIESYRSDFAAWALIAFGCVYFVWGLKGFFRQKRDTSVFSKVKTLSPTLWVLFIIFVVGPCEPLFFLMTYPSLMHNPAAVMVLIGVFGMATILTMEAVVLGASFGLSFVRGGRIARFAPCITGMVIMSCGIGIKFLGL